MTAYKSFLAGSVINFHTPQGQFISDFNSYVLEEFDYASDLETIQVESSFSSGSFIDRKVRVLTAINSETGDKLGDDYKKLLFNTSASAGSIGTKYKRGNNYYLTINTETDADLVSSNTIRRCNNVLKWTNSSGSQLSEHCIIDYKISAPKDIYRSDPILPDGTIHLYAQLNIKTQTIQENQRFLFGREGQFSCYKIYGAGIRNWLNEQTEINTSASLVEFILGRDMINYDLDNTELGIADYYRIPSSGSSTVNSISITPVSGSVLEDDTQVYEVYLYSGSTVLPDAFTFAVSGSTTVASANYVFTSIDDNSFSIQNITQDLDNSIFINCTSGSNLRVKEIWLRGAW